MKMTRPTCNGLLSRRQAVALLAAFGVAEETLAQNATTANPRSYRVVLENERVRVIEYKSRPGLGVCGEGLHSHPAHLTIALSDAKVRVTLPDGKKIVVGNKLGDVFWSEAETHATENVGSAPARALVVELKTSSTKT